MTSSCFTSLGCSCKSSAINCLLFHWFVNVISEIIKTFITLIAKKWDSILFFDRNAIYAWVKVFELINVEIFRSVFKIKTTKSSYSCNKNRKLYHIYDFCTNNIRNHLWWRKNPSVGYYRTCIRITINICTKLILPNNRLTRALNDRDAKKNEKKTVFFYLDAKYRHSSLLFIDFKENFHSTLIQKWTSRS